MMIKNLSQEVASLDLAVPTFDDVQSMRDSQAVERPGALAAITGDQLTKHHGTNVSAGGNAVGVAARNRFDVRNFVVIAPDYPATAVVVAPLSAKGAGNGIPPRGKPRHVGL